MIEGLAQVGNIGEGGVRVTQEMCIRDREMADVLFGVSMQGDGVTKVISQKLDQALKHAE